MSPSCTRLSALRARSAGEAAHLPSNPAAADKRNSSRDPRDPRRQPAISVDRPHRRRWTRTHGERTPALGPRVGLGHLSGEVQGLSAAHRRLTVAQGLAAQGKRVVDVAGGTLAWSAAGHGLARSAGSPNWTQWLLPIAACLTLGLAPFLPEPHLVGKLRWVAGGAVGMSAMDALDLCLHGAPFVWLGWTAVGSRGRAV